MGDAVEAPHAVSNGHIPTVSASIANGTVPTETETALDLHEIDYRSRRVSFSGRALRSRSFRHLSPTAWARWDSGSRESWGDWPVAGYSGSYISVILSQYPVHCLMCDRRTPHQAIQRSVAREWRSFRLNRGARSVDGSPGCVWRELAATAGLQPRCDVPRHVCRNNQHVRFAIVDVRIRC